MIVRWSKTALANIASITQYIERDKSARAKTFAQEMRQKTNMLSEFPGIGRAGRVLGTRELVIHENYIVPYRVRDNQVQIIRVLHVKRKYP